MTPGLTLSNPLDTMPIAPSNARRCGMLDTIDNQWASYGSRTHAPVVGSRVNSRLPFVGFDGSSELRV